MDDLFRQLEMKIRSLLNQHHELKQSHQHLHQNHLQRSREKESLMFKQQKAITQIESLVSKLKTLEKIP